MEKIIYLDNSATTPVFKEVSAEIKKYLTAEYGNPSSEHELGEKAKLALNESRKKLASEIGAKPSEIVFTSGGTESNNLAIFGVSKANPQKKKIIISCIEHSSIRKPALELKKHGHEIIEINVNKEGLLNLEELEKNIDEKTLLVSIIHCNNEIGVLQDLKKIGEICKKKNVLFHTDAVQSFGKEKINVHESKIDLLSASAHKIGGPKGVGFLFVREGINIKPLFYGGEQERGLRPGTENLSSIAGFAKALEIIKKYDFEKIRQLRDYFILELEKMGGKLNGSKEKRAWNNVNVSFPFDAERAIIKLSQKGIYCSTKSACLSKQKEESHVLKSICLNKKEIQGSIRFGLFVNTKKIEIDCVLKEIKNLLKEPSLKLM